MQSFWNPTKGKGNDGCILNGCKQRENRLRDSLGKFSTLHKARAVYLGGRGRNKNFTQI